MFNGCKNGTDKINVGFASQFEQLIFNVYVALNSLDNQPVQNAIDLCWHFNEVAPSAQIYLVCYWLIVENPVHYQKFSWQYCCRINLLSLLCNQSCEVVTSHSTALTTCCYWWSLNLMWQVLVPSFYTCTGWRALVYCSLFQMAIQRLCHHWLRKAVLTRLSKLPRYTEHTL